jgi:hypothetical protein
VADKLTALTLAALAKVAASPAGMALYGTRSAPGLFPNTTTGRTAARRAVDQSFLTPNRLGNETYAATDSGLQFLLDQSNPKAVLEDLVRGLEARQEQVNELLSSAQIMTAELTSLKRTVAAFLPAVVQTRLALPPSPLGGEGLGVRGDIRNGLASSPEDSSNTTRNQSKTTADPLPAAILARLSDWANTAGAGQDCPLPDLYRNLTVGDDLTVGRFHDGLRALHAAGQLYLHPWTGPLYALPEPAFALMIGHEVAYYASRSGQCPVVSGRKKLATDH